ncbi:hypothetical protein CC86DRAFT_294505 [Ophiobolus disseminans]|uniref:Uncharacterized protein n=1 Tax=Ophiobolus disseminans TaxID=1469910 RepID=A0A6A6ZYC1_9PLEO|nr:hypothetical protein CC86DRAFT_294505 [Ophiobolus disseminans]
MPPPIADKVEANQLKLYTIPQTKPKTLTVRNYCSYKIFYQHVGSGGVLGNGTLEAGGTWATPTDIGGSNFKASKTEDLAKVVQVEYNRGAALWYNLSLIDCLARGPDGQRTKDATGCVGLEAGLQFGNKENKSFQCKPGTWCDDQAYFYPENMCKEINPVTNCAQDLGVTMEFCASKKS